MTSLYDSLDIEAEKWEHEPGDKLVGEILELGTYHSTKGFEPSPTVIVEVEGERSTEKGGAPIPEGAKRIFYASRTVARSKLAGRAPSEGDGIGIKALGIKEGKDYYDYNLDVERRGNGDTPATLPEDPTPDPAPTARAENAEGYTAEEAARMAAWEAEQAAGEERPPLQNTQAEGEDIFGAEI